LSKIDIKKEDLEVLEEKLKGQNRINEKKMKEAELQKAKEEHEKANLMVE
jgi:hypothetical protein